MLKIVIIGGLGTIGQMISPILKEKHEVEVLDIASNDEKSVKVDATDYENLCDEIPEDTDVIINLLSIQTTDTLIPIEKLDENIDVFLKATYNIYHCAATKKIKKVIYASSNHTSDYYEENGDSLLGREIKVTDYPYSKGLYGVLKLASENIGHAFAEKYGMSVVNLRLGSVRLNENEAILSDVERFKKTWMSEKDVIQVFEKSIEADIHFGTYFAVSDNEGKPWDISNVERDLGFTSLKTTADILRENQ